MTTPEPYARTLADAAAAIARRELSPVELVDSVLARIRAVEPEINAFATVTEDLARRQAAQAERARVTGPGGPADRAVSKTERFEYHMGGWDGARGEG